MKRHVDPGWRWGSLRETGAVDAALAGDSATLSCGPHTFDFAKTRTALHDVEVRLSHRRDCACGSCSRVREYPDDEVGDRDVCSIERLIPAVTGDVDDATRAIIEAERLSTVGRALFAHVARLVALAENRPRGRRTLRFRATTGRQTRRTEAHGRGRICAIPGCGTLLSTYNPSPSCAAHDATGPPQHTVGVTPLA